jgi:hypothetical protein
MGLEPMASSLPRTRSTTELQQHIKEPPLPFTMANTTTSNIIPNENYVIYKKILKYANTKQKKNKNSYNFLKLS